MYFCAMEIHQFLDATYLKTATQAGISEEESLQNVLALTKEAIQFEYKLIMIRAHYIPVVRTLLKKANSKTLIGTVIGFHEGTATVTEKLIEAQKAIDLGVDELDFVLNFKAFTQGNFSLIDHEILECTKLSLQNDRVIKWIIETAALTNEEIVVISRRIKELVLTHFKDTATQRVFVKTSTGFYLTENNVPNGATLENIQLIVANAKPLQVKAAGGVRDYQMAKKMIALGVDRIGTSSSKEICCQEITTTKNNLY